MSKVIVDISMSLDGFATAANQTAEQPLGDEGERLHAWAFGGEEGDREALRQAQGVVGAIVCGRRTYDHSLPWWGADGPGGEARVPVVVVTHDRAPDPPADGVYTFAGSIAGALDQARARAGGRDVSVLGGPDVIGQCLAAGVVDELWLHVAPVLLGAGTRLFEAIGGRHIRLETDGALQTAAATHLRYRVPSDRDTGAS